MRRQWVRTRRAVAARAALAGGINKDGQSEGKHGTINWKLKTQANLRAICGGQWLARCLRQRDSGLAQPQQLSPRHLAQPPHVRHIKLGESVAARVEFLPGRVGVQLVGPLQHRRELLHLARDGEQAVCAGSEREILRQQVVVEVLRFARFVHGSERRGELLKTEARVICGVGFARCDELVSDPAVASLRDAVMFRPLSQARRRSAFTRTGRSRLLTPASQHASLDLYAERYRASGSRTSARYVVPSFGSSAFEYTGSLGRWGVHLSWSWRNDPESSREKGLP